MSDSKKQKRKRTHWKTKQLEFIDTIVEFPSQISDSSGTDSDEDESPRQENSPKRQKLQHDDNQDQKDIASLRAKVSALEEELRESQKQASVYLRYCEEQKGVIRSLLIAVSIAERQVARLKVNQDTPRLGTFTIQRAGTDPQERWKHGQRANDLYDQWEELAKAKKTVQQLQKSLKGQKDETGEQEDGIYKCCLAKINLEEEANRRERERNVLEKTRFSLEVTRIRNEDASRFNKFQILKDRYLLMSLLDKGEFIEVYKAYDMVGLRYVACKLCCLDPSWPGEWKEIYIRRIKSEYDIQKALVHRHIVRAWDFCENDQNTYCIILEYCSGKDLRALLESSVLPEWVARSILIQIFQGLVYMNKKEQKIIHHDLRPKNVLFDELGIAKLADFGLSKIVEEDVGSNDIELISEDAGTYWYMPPECFDKNKTPMISSKVDVWSAGVLLYKMLFGRFPVWRGLKQEILYRPETLHKACTVEFSSEASVSTAAKDFIRRCLTCSLYSRPDVLTIAEDPYLVYPKE